jgi:hypothetical protein
MGGLALFISLGGVGYAATGGNFILGQGNTATTQTALSAPIAGKALQLTNTSTAAGATALGLTVAAGKTPFTVNSGTRVANLNADKVDGFHAAQLEGARAYAWGGGLNCSPGAYVVFCPVHNAKGVAYIVKVAPGTYCVGVNGISAANSVAVVSENWSSTVEPSSRISMWAWWRSDNSACVPQEFEIKTEGTGAGSTAVATDNVAFSIAIP